MIISLSGSIVKIVRGGLRRKTVVKVFVFDLKYFAASNNLVEFCKESADSLFSQKSDAVRKILRGGLWWTTEQNNEKRRNYLLTKQLNVLNKLKVLYML